MHCCCITNRHRFRGLRQCRVLIPHFCESGSEPSSAGSYAWGLLIRSRDCVYIWSLGCAGIDFWVHWGCGPNSPWVAVWLGASARGCPWPLEAALGSWPWWVPPSWQQGVSGPQGGTHTTFTSSLIKSGPLQSSPLWVTQSQLNWGF